MELVIKTNSICCDSATLKIAVYPVDGRCDGESWLYTLWILVDGNGSLDYL
jgi:hypothetical protein